MKTGRHVLSQIVNFVHWEKSQRLARRYEPNQKIKHFGFRQQFICMVFAQLTWREGLRDIETCLNARPECLYHLGFEKPMARSTLAEANEQRDWRVWQDLGHWLIPKARKLYEAEDLGLELDNSIYALDSTTIDLCLKLFPWADFRSTKAGIKMHTQLDLRGSIPSVIDITSAKKADVIPSPQNKWTIRRWKFGVEQGGRVQRYANITPDLTTKLSAKITSQMVQLF